MRLRSSPSRFSKSRPNSPFSSCSFSAALVDWNNVPNGPSDEIVDSAFLFMPCVVLPSIHFAITLVARNPAPPTAPTKITAAVATAFESVADDSSTFMTSPFGVATAVGAAVGIRTAFNFSTIVAAVSFTGGVSLTLVTTFSAAGRSIFSTLADDGFSALGETTTLAIGVVGGTICVAAAVGASAVVIGLTFFGSSGSLTETASAATSGDTVFVSGFVVVVDGNDDF